MKHNTLLCLVLLFIPETTLTKKMSCNKVASYKKAFDKAYDQAQARSFKTETKNSYYRNTWKDNPKTWENRLLKNSENNDSYHDSKEDKAETHYSSETKQKSHVGKKQPSSVMKFISKIVEAVDQPEVRLGSVAAVLLYVWYKHYTLSKKQAC